MKTTAASFIRNSRGVTFLSVLIAAVVLLCAFAGIGVSAMHLNQATRKAEVANLGVILEAELVNQFNLKTNYPEPGAAAPVAAGCSSGGSSPNNSLRSGTAQSVTICPVLDSGSGLGPLTIPIVVPVVAAGQTGVVGYLSRSLRPCAGFSAAVPDCVLKYEIRLKMTQTDLTLPPTYAYSYQIDSNPAVITTAPIGGVNLYDNAIDPGMYRVERTLAKCDPANDLFMVGINRDTGEALCAQKPLTSKCPDGRLPKGYNLVHYSTQAKPVVELLCSSSPVRTYSCPSNYALQTFDPKYTDPETTIPTAAPGKCVFQFSRSQVTPSNYPINPVPYMRSVSGTFCPPYYKAGGPACNLVPDNERNNSSQSTGGMGKCGATKYKNCTRTATTTVSDNGAAYQAFQAAWSACMATVPRPADCGQPPPNPVITTTCSAVENSSTCNGSPDRPSGCQEMGAWSGGTPYADNFYTTTPTATPSSLISGRSIACTFTDTSPLCTAPPLDINGQPWGKKDPHWYGGVQVSGATCTFDQAVGGPEVVDAQL